VQSLQSYLVLWSSSFLYDSMMDTDKYQVTPTPFYFYFFLFLYIFPPQLSSLPGESMGPTVPGL
jgi:hypothetical protein